MHKARVKIPNDHACFAGHFPGHPILPGVLLLERVLSLARSRLDQSLDDCAISNVKFLAPVVPGDEVAVSLTEGAVREFRFAVRIVGTADDEGVLACTGQLRVADKKS